MNKRVLFIVVIILGVISAKAQVAISDYVPLQKGFNSFQWFPYVAIMTDDGDSFQLVMRNPDTHDYKKSHPMENC